MAIPTLSAAAPAASPISFTGTSFNNATQEVAHLTTLDIIAQLGTQHLVGKPVGQYGAWSVAVSFQEDPEGGPLWDLRLCDESLLPREPHWAMDKPPYFKGYQATISLATDIQPGDQVWARVTPEAFVVAEMSPDRTYRALHTGDLLHGAEVIGRLESVSRFFTRTQQAERESAQRGEECSGMTYLAGDTSVPAGPLAA